MGKYIVLAVLLALGVLLYIRRDEVMDYVRGMTGTAQPTEEVVVGEVDIEAGDQ